MSSVPRWLRLLLFFVLLIGVSVLVALLCVRWMAPPAWAHDQPHGHQWLHQELGLTDGEAARIDAFEGDYRAERQRLQAAFDQRVAAIAELLQTQDRLSPEVSHAVHELHAVHGQLQQLAIEHYFDMLSVLPPEKQQRLRALAVEALSTPQ